MHLHPDMAAALDTLDPTVRDCGPVLELLARQGRSALALRTPLAAPDSYTEEGVDVRTVILDSREDGSSLRVRRYRPEGAAVQPALVYFHGGGFVFGAPEDEDLRCIYYAREAACTVLSVDYRLAPEHPYPAGLEDCILAWQSITRQAAALGIDSARMALGGASAGGGLAAATAIALRDLGLPPPLLQLLIYPVLDDRLDTPSMHSCGDTPVWNRKTARKSWAMYLGQAGKGTVPDTAAPARVSNLSGLPPAYLATAEHDPLRDEGLAFGLRLLQHGISVELHNYAGTLHGFDVLAAGSKLSQCALLEQARALAGALHKPLHAESVGAPGREHATES